MKHAAFALLLLISATAQADEGRILITAPQFITTPGSYLLANDLACTNFCIEIEASDVKLDLNGFTLRKAPGHSSSGVLFGVNTKNIEVTNGAITGFPVCGVHVSGTSQFGRNLRISNLRISDNVIFGISLEKNAGYIVEGNVISGSKVGIYAAAPGLVQNNVVGFHTEIGLALYGNQIGYRSNVLHNNALNLSGTPTSLGANLCSGAPCP